MVLVYDEFGEDYLRLVAVGIITDKIIPYISEVII